MMSIVSATWNIGKNYRGHNIMAKFWYFCIVEPSKIKNYQVCDFFCVFFWLLGEKYILSWWFCNMLLISIFAAHVQHAHADGLFNNGLHFEEVK